MKPVAGAESVWVYVWFRCQLQCEVCVCVCFWKIEKRGETEWRSNGVGSTAHFQRAVWHSLEGMRGWITLLAATATFQWGSTLSSPLSNPRWNDHLCKMKMRPEIKWPACLLQLHGWTRDWRNLTPLGPKMESGAEMCFCQKVLFAFYGVK